MDKNDIELMFGRKVEAMTQCYQICKRSFENPEETSKAIRAVPKPLMNEEALDQLTSIVNNITERQRCVVDQERDCKQSVQNMEKEIAELEDECNKLKNSIEEIKKLHCKKMHAALKKAKTKYSSALGMLIHTRDLDGEYFVAVVKLTGETGKTISLTVNRSTRKVTAFDATQLMSQEQAAELQRAVTDQEGQIDMRKLMAKVRPMCIEKTIS